jgi:O-antigen/teichoic acid export membrane protein
MLRNTSYYSRSFFWGVISKIIDALVKFITIPLLLQYFGKENYGILTLAIATNAYMHILDLGINTGAIKYFSQWISEKNTELIEKVARSSLTFYFYIGFINSLLLIALGVWGESLLM